MDLKSLQYCPGTLAEGFSTYSATCLRQMFGGKKVSHVLPYPLPQQNEAVAELFMENRKRISISGVQEKLSLLLDASGRLVLEHKADRSGDVQLDLGAVPAGAYQLLFVSGAVQEAQPLLVHKL